MLEIRVGKGILSKGVTNLICISSGSHCQVCWGETVECKDKRETHLEAITLIEGSDDGGPDEGCSSKSGKKSSVSVCLYKLETTEFTDNWTF